MCFAETMTQALYAQEWQHSTESYRRRTTVDKFLTQLLLTSRCSKKLKRSVNLERHCESNITGFDLINTLLVKTPATFAMHELPAVFETRRVILKCLTGFIEKRIKLLGFYLFCS